MIMISPLDFLGLLFQNHVANFVDLPVGEIPAAGGVGNTGRGKFEPLEHTSIPFLKELF